MLLPFFEWCESTAIGTAVRNSIWAFPVIEAIHLLGLCLLGGAVLLVDLRMVGAGLRRQSTANLVRQVRPWMLAAIGIMVVTGTLLFLSEAVKCYYNTSFWVKMSTLPVALLFTFLVRDKVALGGVKDMSAGMRFVGLASIALWFTVAAAGRWIGFS